METRKEWEGNIINHPALMNAIWEFFPQYAMHLNGKTDTNLNLFVSMLLNRSDFEVFPKPDENRRVYMFPEAETDFLLLE